ncbi:MAG: hypothetical protein GY841_11010 [FCB group bacterium]|nr:hypothetical protein [FCB group bacterium]
MNSQLTLFNNMKTSIFPLIAAILLFSPVFSQDTADTTSKAPDTDSLLAAGLDEILSYLHLSKDDFVFRDDYLKKDPYRLAVIDSLMAHPLNMVPFTDSCARIMRGFEKTPGVVTEFFSGIRGVLKDDSTSIGDDTYELALNPTESAIVWPRCYDIHTMMSAYQQILFEALGGDWDSNLNQFIRNKYKELILEDENFKNQTAEEMDSIQHLEDGYARQFSELAAKISDFPFLHFADVNLLLDIMADHALSRFGFSDPLVPSGDNLMDSLGLMWNADRETDLGRMAVGTFGNDTYRGDYFMIIDPGGDDSYYLTYDIENPHPTIIADFGGDDFYKAESDFALASGAFSYSLLVDYEGDDIYRGKNFSLGSGYFGQGILWDKKGNDSYFGDTFTQGAGTFGLGLLIDGQGNDTYTGNLYCQGMGFVRGIGGIADYDGNDTYTVQPKYPEVFHPGQHYQSLSQGFAIGFRPKLSGGFGFICDYGGNDAYIADFFAQGSSYWWSLGMLYDKSGNDQYLSYQYAQGAGAHMTLGILLDGGGDDVYRSHGVAQGCGHDYSCGWLLDRGGDDIYTSEGLSQGAGQANGFGLFTDLTGRDGYYVFNKANCQGYGNPRRDYGSIGLFLDMDGKDHYDGQGTNNRFWTIPSKWGGGLDRELFKADSTEAK